MIIEAGGLSVQAVLRLAIARDGNEHRDFFALVAQACRELVAIYIRQADVKQRDIRNEVLRERNCFVRRIGDLGRVRLALAQQSERIRCVAIVVDNQNA